MKVEPRVLEVLLHLARNHDRIVSKEELIDFVWKKKFVSESALTRCIMEARRVLQTNGGDPSALKTIHGRGYRFELGDPLVPESTPAPIESRSRRWTLPVALLLLLVTSAIGGALHHRRSNPQPLRIALMPISVDGDDRELQLVAISMNDLLKARLTATPRLIIRGPDYENDAVVEASSLAVFAQRVGAEYVINGTLRRAGAGSKAHLMVTLFEVVRPNRVRHTPLGRYDIPLLGTSTAVVKFATTRDRIVQQLVRQLLPAVSLPSLEGIVPRDAQAYRFYLLAMDRMSDGICDGDTALELLGRSLEIDPAFAPAWEALGWAHYGVVSSCSGNREHYRHAVEAADRALTLRPLSTDAIALKATVLTETGHAEEAYVLLQQALHGAPSNPDLHCLLFHVLTYAGQLPEAERWLDALLKIDPNYLTQRGWTPVPYLYSGKTSQFLQALPGTDTPLFRYYRGLAEAKTGHVEEARRILEPAFRLNPSDSFARLSHALLAILENKPVEADEVLKEIVRERRLLGREDGEMTYKIAQLFGMAGDREGALDQLSSAVDQGFFCVPCIQDDSAFRALHGDARFANLLSRAGTRQASFTRRFVPRHS